jgi:signal transduction histidine kinase
MSQLPIRALRLYKQGIGYFERRGEIQGETVSLVIPRETTNDALKSLNITVHRGGPLLSVDYETPEDKNKILAELSIKIADRSSLVDLLNSLRGSRVILHLHSNLEVTGRVVGVETSLDAAVQPPSVILQGETDPTVIQVVSVAEISGLSLLDQRAITDVRFFLDVSQTELTRTTLTVRLADGQHDLAISYLAGSPTWRVSYRIVSDSDNTARLVGWGLFDNSLDEDLENVSLTLVSGRPISFEYGLYESRTPSRPKVSDDPAGLESVSTDPRVREALSAISHDLRTPLTSIVGFADLLARVGTLTKEQGNFVNSIRQSAKRMSDMMNSLLDIMRLKEEGGDSDQPRTSLYRSGPLGDLKVSSSYFIPLVMGNAETQFMTYEVKTPVSVKRGQSAMVPIVDAPLTVEALCVYNGDKMPNHPLLVWRLQNTTGVALEQGPVTIIHDGQYLGEGLMRFTGAGDDIQIPYALEFGILVTEETNWSEKELFSLTFDSERREVIVRRYQIFEHVYLLSNRMGAAVRVLIERRDPTRGEYFEMPPADFAVEGHTRWGVEVPAHGETTTTIRVRDVYESKEDISSWQLDYVEEMRTAGVLAEAPYNLLKNLLDEKQRAADEAEELKSLQSEYEQIVSLQEQLRKNLDALGQSEREAAIRNRVLDDLDASENRRREIETRTVSLNSQIKQRQQTQQTIIDQIYGSAE